MNLSKSIYLSQRATLSFALLLALLPLALLSSSTAHASDNALTSVERAIPEFNLQGVDAKAYTPDSLKGKVWLINFWAVWCAPCLDELPSLNAAWEQLQEHEVGMLAINIGESAEAIDAFLSSNNLQIDFPIVIGDKLRTLGNWSIRALPHTVVVDKNGTIVFEASGPREWDNQEIVDAITALK